MKAQVGPRPSMQLAESDPEVLAVLSAPTEIRDYRATLPGFWRSILLTLRFRACQGITLPAQLEKVVVGDFAVAPGVARNELEAKATDRRSVSFLPSSPVPIFPQIYRKQTAVWGQLQRES